MVTSVAARVAGLDEHLGSHRGRPARPTSRPRAAPPDPYENVCLADPSWVDLVCIGGDITYARADWFDELSGGATGGTIEDLIAWGKPMRLDTGFQAGATRRPSRRCGPCSRAYARRPDLRLSARDRARPPDVVRVVPTPRAGTAGRMVSGARRPQPTRACSSCGAAAWPPSSPSVALPPLRRLAARLVRVTTARTPMMTPSEASVGISGTPARCRAPSAARA